LLSVLQLQCSSRAEWRGGTLGRASESRPGNLFLPEQGCVPNEEVATNVAQALLKSVYGDGLDNQRPFRAELLGDSVWAVAGSRPKGVIGGVAYIEIRKSDASVVGMGHSK
jgi:hypothetical protein